MSLSTRPLAPVSDYTLIAVALSALFLGFLTGMAAPNTTEPAAVCAHPSHDGDATASVHDTGTSESLDDVRKPDK